MAKEQGEKLVGEVTHYYSGAGVAIVKLSDSLSKDDEVHFCGGTTDFSQTVDSMQINHQDISSAKKGDEIGVKVVEKVREGDEVYLK